MIFIATAEVVGVLVIASLFGYLLFEMCSASKADKDGKDRKDGTHRM